MLSPNNLGDLSLHLTYVRYLANGVPFWPDNPIFTGGKLIYPIGVDLFHSLCVLVGMDVFRGFVWIGLVGAALTGATLWRWGRGFALFGFLANGGLAAIALFRHRAAGRFLKPNWPGKSLVLALFATQRGLLFALPVGLLLLSSWRTRFFGAGDHLPAPASSSLDNPKAQEHPHDNWQLPFWGEVLLYASLPLFHFHTFLFLSALLAVWFVLPPAPRGADCSCCSSASAFRARDGARLALHHRWFQRRTSMPLGWKAGWMWDDQSFRGLVPQTHWHSSAISAGSPGLTFWPLNFGILPILVVFLVAVLCQPQRNSWPRLVVFPALGMFIICCFVKFAPWEWDNTKLMIWSYLAILPFLWSELLARWPASGAQSARRQKLSPPVPDSRSRPATGVPPLAEVTARLVSPTGRTAQVLCVVGALSSPDSFLTCWAASMPIACRILHRHPLGTLTASPHALRGIPVTERFAGAPTYNHPILLNGRKMVLGYLGHVHSHGLAWEEPSAKLDALMNGGEGWQALAVELGARYLLWGSNEEETYKDSTQPWKQSARLVASGDWGTIFDLQSAPTGGPESKE